MGADTDAHSGSCSNHRIFLLRFLCFTLLRDQMSDLIGRFVFVLISVASFLVGFLCCVGICEADCVGHAGDLPDHPGR